MINDELAKAKTSKKEFLDKMEKLIPWNEFIGIIKPVYYKGETGNKPYDLELIAENICSAKYIRFSGYESNVRNH